MSNPFHNLITCMPHPVLTPITDIPTYETLTTLCVQLNFNDNNITLSLGDGEHGNLVLTLTPEEYKDHTSKTFKLPSNPGPIPPNYTNLERDEIKHKFITYKPTLIHDVFYSR